MLKKNEIKDIQSLRHKNLRDEAGLFTAEGPKIISELIASSPQKCKKIYALESWLLHHRELLAGLPVEAINEVELERISQLKTPNEVVGVWQQFDSVEPQIENTFALYLDAIQDPGNFGTIIRIADWFGVKHIVCGNGCADLYNSKVVQATMASIGRVNVYYDQDFLWLKKQTVPVYAAVLGGASVYEVGTVLAGVLIIGNESKGIQPKALENATKKITIPKRGEAESLNAAVATGIILSHLLK